MAPSVSVAALDAHAGFGADGGRRSLAVICIHAAACIDQPTRDSERLPVTAMGIIVWMLGVAACIAPVCALLWRAAMRGELRGCARR